MHAHCGIVALHYDCSPCSWQLEDTQLLVSSAC
jgi:hypothetical protein